MLLSAAFSGAQLTLIIVISITCAALFLANAVLLTVFYYKRKRKKLCTPELNRRREELLEELASLRNMKEDDRVAADSAEEVAGEEENDAEPEDSSLPSAAVEETGEDAAEELAETAEEDGDESEDSSLFRTEILAVGNMTPLMREKFGFVGREYDQKRYYIRTVNGFEAKLRLSKNDVKSRYMGVFDEIRRYREASAKRSFRQERIYVGRKTLAMLLFRGKTLCIAFALDPKKYADTKYYGEDKSQVKRFKNTPMLLRLTSNRRVEYAKYLFGEVAKANGLDAGELTKMKYDLKRKPRAELFAQEKVKIVILGEVDELGFDPFDEAEDIAVSAPRASILPVAEMSPLMREKFGFVGAAYDAKSYYVRYGYSFEAKLRMANETVKSRYTEFIKEAGRYHKVTLSGGFRQARLGYGRRTLALLFFKGKTLCIAFALDPKKFEDTKFRGIDAGDVKRFKNTPMLLKITSERRLGYAKYLLNRLADERSIRMNETPVEREFTLAEMPMSDLYAQGAIKITVVGEVPAEALREVAATDHQ